VKDLKKTMDQHDTLDDKINCQETWSCREIYFWFISTNNEKYPGGCIDFIRRMWYTHQ